MSTVTLEQLTSRLGHLEREVAAIRRTLEALQPDAGALTTPADSGLANKITFNEQMQQLLQQFSITGQPLGPEFLQEQMAQTDLRRNELSQSLIEARGE